MTETIRINWLLLAGPFLWSAGIAVFLSLAGLMEFYRVQKNVKRRDFLSGKLCRNYAIIGIVFILCGIFMGFAKMSTDRFIAVKLNNDRKPSLDIVKSGESYPFLPKELKMDPKNRSHYLNNKGMKNNTMALFWDGFVRTPFMKFKKGNYQIHFQAKGSKAEGEFSKIKVEFEVPGKNNFLEAEKLDYFQLTPQMKTYKMEFQIEQAVTGRLSIIYFNDLYIPETKKGRDVWIKDIYIYSD